MGRTRSPSSSMAMRINRLDLNQIACLEALLAERSVSAAARRMHLSQPALSATLARMREYFDDPLLLQNGRAFVLTPFAQALIEPVRDLMFQARALTARRPEADPARIQRQVTIVASDYAFRVFLAPLFARAEHEAPGLNFEVRSISGYIGDELDQGDVDLVVSLASGMSGRHLSEVLYEEGFSCIAWRGSRYLGPTLTKRTYLAAGHAITILGRGRVPTLDQLAMEAQGLTRRVEVRVPAFSMLASAIVGSQRIATVQTSLAHMLEREADVRVLNCPIRMDPVITAVQWHPYQTYDPAISWVRGCLREVAALMPGRPGQAGARRAPASDPRPAR